MLIELSRHNKNNSTQAINFFRNNTINHHNNSNEGFQPIITKESEEDSLMCDIYETRPTSLRNNKWYIILYVFLSEFILIEIIPWILVIILNIKTWKGVRRFQQKRQTLRRSSGIIKGNY